MDPITENRPKKTQNPENTPSAKNPKAPASRAKAYKPKKGEEKDVHVKIEQPDFDKTTGKQRSKPFVQIYNPAAWKQFQEIGPRQGWWVREVLHAPKGVNINYINPDPDVQKTLKKDELAAEIKALEQKLKAL